MGSLVYGRGSPAISTKLCPGTRETSCARGAHPLAAKTSRESDPISPESSGVHGGDVDTGPAVRKPPAPCRRALSDPVSEGPACGGPFEVLWPVPGVEQ